MHYIEQSFSQGHPVIRGKIVTLEKNGKIVVKPDNMEKNIPCDFLRTHAGPLPELFTGMRVLCIYHGSHGYILGVIQPYFQPEKKQDDSFEELSSLDLKAKEKIELTCGKSTLSMNKNGKIILRGTQVTTRAAGANKIKGASIQVN